MSFRGRALLAAVACILAGAASAAWRRPAHAEPPASVESPRRVAFIATPHGVSTRQSEIRFVTLGATSAPDVAISIPHAPGAVVRGDLLHARGRMAAVVADDEGGHGDFASTLWLVDAGTRTARPLAHGVYHASRPLASVDGHVYVERGEKGRPPTREEAGAGFLRQDRLTVDAIDPSTGASRTVVTAEGYTLHLAGELGRELVLYRVDRRGADLIAVDRATGRSRLVTTLPPFARDFTIDAPRAALLLSNRDDHDAHLWVVERVDLATGARTRLTSARDKNPPRDLGEAASLHLGGVDERIELIGTENSGGTPR